VVKRGKHLHFIIIYLENHSGHNLRNLYIRNTDVMGMYVNYQGQRVFALRTLNVITTYEYTWRNQRIINEIVRNIHYPSCWRIPGGFFNHILFPAPDRATWINIRTSENHTIYTGLGRHCTIIEPTAYNIRQIPSLVLSTWPTHHVSLDNFCLFCLILFERVSSRLSFKWLTSNFNKGENIWIINITGVKDS
jgi:hypothetical protein